MKDKNGVCTTCNEWDKCSVYDLPPGKPPKECLKNRRNITTNFHIQQFFAKSGTISIRLIVGLHQRSRKSLVLFTISNSDLLF